MSDTMDSNAQSIDENERSGDAEELLESLSERYKMFVTNRPNSPAVGFDLNYVTDDGWDKPVIYNTGGEDALHSMSTSVGGDAAINVDERFFNSIAYSYHQVMCFMTQTNPERQKEKIDDTIRIFYENDAEVNQVPDQERWAIHRIVNHFVFRDEVLYEFGPIREYTNMCTEWGVPEVEAREAQE